MNRASMVWLVVAAIVADAGPIRSAEPDSVAKTAETEHLPGMIPAPKRAAGKPRWQLVPAYPRGEVWACEYSPDGKWLAFGDGPHVRIVDAQSLKLERMLVGHRGRIIQIAWSPDSSRLATVGNDTTVRLWSSAGVPGQVFREHRHPVRGVAWRPDCKQLLSGDQDGKVCLWSPEGKVAKSIGLEAAVYSVAWKPDGSQFATGDENRSIRLWKPDGTETKKLEAHHGGVNSIAWSPDGKMIVSCCHGTELDDGGDLDAALLCLWNEDGSLISSHTKYSRPLFHVAWRPDGGLFAIGAYGGQLRFWDPAGEERPGAIDATRAIHPSWHPDGERIAAGFFLMDEYTMGADTSGAAVVVWNAKSRAIEGQIPRLSTGICSVALSPDGSQIATGAENGGIATFSIDGKAGAWRNENSRVSGVSWMRDGTKLAYCGPVTPAAVWTVASQNSTQTLPGNLPMWSIHANPADESILGVRSMAARLWAGSPDSSVTSIATAHEHGATGIRWSRDGKQFATSSFDSTVRIFNADGTKGPVLQDAGASTRCVDWSPDGKRLVSGRENGTVKTWSAEGKEEQLLEGHDWYVQAVAWSPDGKQVATGSWDNTVRLWNDRGELLSTFWGHEGSVFALAWLPDSKRIISAAEDGTVRLWEAASGKTAWVAFIHGQGKSATFSGEGAVIHWKSADVSARLLGLIERPDGSMEIVPYDELRKRID